jgi:hypothetical protein
MVSGPTSPPVQIAVACSSLASVEREVGDVEALVDAVADAGGD